MRPGRRVGIGLVLLGLVLLGTGLAGGLAAQAPAAPAAPTASPLAECDRGKAENLKLRAQVLELQRALAQAQLDRETARLEADRQTLEATFRGQLQPAPGEVFDWQTLVFRAPDPGPASSAAPSSPPTAR